MRTVPRAHELLDTSFLTLQADWDIFDAIVRMAEERLSGAPVVDEEGRLIGILSEKDCLRVVANIAYSEVVTGTVRDFMSEPKGTLTGDMDLFSIAREFLVSNFAALPVLDNGKPVGSINRRNLLRHIGELHPHKKKPPKTAKPASKATIDRQSVGKHSAAVARQKSGNGTSRPRVKVHA